MRSVSLYWLVSLSAAAAACSSSKPAADVTDHDASSGTSSSVQPDAGAPLDPAAAPVAFVDRFQDSFATLFKRSAPAFDPAAVSKILPGPNDPIDMDKYFTVMALGPDGQDVLYYALDILPTQAGQAYLLVGSDGTPVANQLPIVGTLPGDKGYNDFVEIEKVTVSAGYIANTITSLDALRAAMASKVVSAPAKPTSIANWAFVPKGTTATRSFAGSPVSGHRAWYKDQVADYLLFDTDLADVGGTVPGSGIIVIFENGMNPSQGFDAEPDGQTHNALETLPGEKGYSSYWFHEQGKVSGFASVTSYATAQANVSGALPGVNVNCPVVQ